MNLTTGSEDFYLGKQSESFTLTTGSSNYSLGKQSEDFSIINGSIRYSLNSVSPEVKALLAETGARLLSEDGTTLLS